MIQEQTIEQPGINAIEHACEMQVELPGEDDEQASFTPCRILAKAQCSECSAWVCGTEELDHSIICAKCDKTFCPEHFASHRVSRECEA